MLLPLTIIFNKLLLADIYLTTPKNLIRVVILLFETSDKLANFTIINEKFFFSYSQLYLTV